MTVPTGLSVLFALVAVICWFLGVGQLLPVAWDIALTPTSIRGRILALRFVANQVSQVVVPSLAGAASHGAGVNGVMATGAAATGLTALLVLRERRRTDPTPRWAVGNQL